MTPKWTCWTVLWYDIKRSCGHFFFWLIPYFDIIFLNTMFEKMLFKVMTTPTPSLLLSLKLNLEFEFRTSHHVRSHGDHCSLSPIWQISKLRPQYSKGFVQGRIHWVMPVGSQDLGFPVICALSTGPCCLSSVMIFPTETQHSLWTQAMNLTNWVLTPTQPLATWVVSLSLNSSLKNGGNCILPLRWSWG